MPAGAGAHTVAGVLVAPGRGPASDYRATGEAAFAAVYPDSRNPFAHPELLAEGASHSGSSRKCG